VKTLDGRGDPTSTYYDPLGAVAETVDAVGNPSYSFLDADGRVTGTKDADGYTTKDLYNLVGDLVQSVDKRGKSSFFRFDLLDRQVATTDPNGNRWQSVLDAVGNTVASIDANNKASYATFDADNRAVRTKDADGNTNSETFDPAGNVTSTTDANGATSFAWFDGDNREVLAQDPNGHYNATVFNNLGEVTATVDGAGDTNQDAYDSDEEQTGQRDGDGNLTQTGFNADGQVTAVTDPDTNTTSFGYDQAGNQIVSADPLGRVTVTTFDADNRVASVTDRLGRKRLNSYDPDGRLLSETWKNADGSTADTRNYTYDQAGNVLTAGNGFGSYVYTYDNAGRRQTQTDPFGKLLTYGYDNDGRVTSVTDNLGGVVNSVYDPAGRLTSRQLTVSGQAQASVGLTYTPRGQLATAQRSANTGGTLQVVGQSVYNYDTAGNVQRIRHQNAAGTTNLLDLNSTYDSADRLFSETDNGVTTPYGYDNASQVTSAGAAGYSYDANGNRNVAGYTVGPDNLLQTATVSGVTWTFTYDLENNLIKKTQGSNAPTWYYTYNLDNQLTSAEERQTDGGTVLVHVNFAYDVYDRRVQTAVTVGTGGVTNYAWERGQVWAELDGSAGNALKVRYLAGDGTDQWLARLVSAGYANAGLSFYLNDRQGSVRGLTDNTGVLQDQISYDAFGNISETNPTFGDGRKYAGYQYEATVGLYYARARWYDPGTGQWTTEDPARFGAGDANLRRYVENNPTNAIDASGLKPVIIVFRGFGETAKIPNLAKREMETISAPFTEKNLVPRIMAGVGRDDVSIKVFSQSQIDDAVKFARDTAIDKAEKNPDGTFTATRDRIIVVGFSAGGDAAMRFVREIGQSERTVDLVFLVDPVPVVRGPLKNTLIPKESFEGYEDKAFPRKLINYYQKTDKSTFPILYGNNHGIQGRPIPNPGKTDAQKESFAKSLNQIEITENDYKDQYGDEFKDAAAMGHLTISTLGVIQRRLEQEVKSIMGQGMGTEKRKLPKPR
jgi:RHS repeat-associated protein